MSNSTPLLIDTIETYREFSTIQGIYEDLKAQVRELGPGDYSVEGHGLVKISAPVERKAKGTVLKFNPNAFDLLDEQTQEHLRRSGVVTPEMTYQNARASAVTVTPYD